MNGGDGADTSRSRAPACPRPSRSSRRRRPAGSSSTGSRRPGPAPFNLDIGTTETLDLNAGGGDDTLATEPRHRPGFKLDVSGGDGNDVLDAGDAADLIAGDAGNDAITPDDNPAGTRDVAQGGDGDDRMIWNGGDDDDVNDGGAGNDTVVGQRRARCPRRSRWTRRRRRVTRPSTVRRRPGPGPFNIDILASERLDLNANGGDDAFASDGAIAALGLRADVDGRRRQRHARRHGRRRPDRRRRRRRPDHARRQPGRHARRRARRRRRRHDRLERR